MSEPKGIFKAAADGNLAELQEFLDSVNNINQIDENEFTPLHWAVNQGQKEMVEYLLLHGADINLTINEGPTVLDLACMRKELDIAKLLIVQPEINKTCQSALCIAAGIGDYQMTALLIEFGFDLNGSNCSGYSPVHWATQERHLDILRLLIESGADPNLPDNDGVTPIYIAASSGYSEIIKYLIEKNVDINTKDNHGTTALMIASAFNREEVISLLLKLNAKTELIDDECRTALFWAVIYDNNEAVDLLLKSGANSNLTDIYGNSLYIVNGSKGVKCEITPGPKGLMLDPE